MPLNQLIYADMNQFSTQMVDLFIIEDTVSNLKITKATSNNIPQRNNQIYAGAKWVSDENSIPKLYEKWV